MHSPETGAAVLDVAADIAAGDMQVVIEWIFPFEQAVAALEKTETGHARGKIDVTVAEDESP